MRKITIVLVGVVLVGVVGFFVQKYKREADEKRAAAIRECMTWPANDQASCESRFEAGSLEIALQVAAHTHLLGLREDVVSARGLCTKLDAGIGYVALGEQARLGTLTAEQEKTSMSLLGQGFDCEEKAARGAVAFRDSQQELAQKQRVAGFEVTVLGVELPDADTPAVEASKAADAK